MLNNIFYFVILFIFLFSCNNKLTPEIPEKPKLVLFSILHPDEKPIVFVTKSIPAFENNRDLAYTDSVLVVLFEENIPIDTLIKTDETMFTSDKKIKVGYSYYLLVKDFTNNLDSIISENVKILPAPIINKITIDSINRLPSDQDSLICKIEFNEFNNKKYLGYQTSIFDNQKKRIYRWRLSDQYKCSEDNSGIDKININRISCFEKVNSLEFYSQNHNLTNIDSIKINLCNVSDLTGDFSKLINLNNLQYDSKLSLLAPDDNFSSNIINGYGVVLTTSCTKKTVVLK